MRDVERNGNHVNAEWTTDNIPNLAGKVIIVTGANSGLGFEAAKEFARRGARTILACRDMVKAQAALVRIRTEIPNAQAETMQLNLASLKSIHRFAEAFASHYDHLHVLLNNAGIMFVPYSQTEDGFESHLGVNHLGHFALTGLLLGLLASTPGSRVVNVSSEGHRMGHMDFDNFLYEGGRGYRSTEAYGRSKLANLLFTYELDRRFRAHNIDAIAVAAHPGSTRGTNLGRSGWFGIVRVFLRPFEFLVHGPAVGVLPILRAAVDPEVKGAEYYGPGGRDSLKGNAVRVESNELSHDEAVAKKLWEVSESLTGVAFHL